MQRSLSVHGSDCGAACRELGWDAATERLLAASRLTAGPPRCSRIMTGAYDWLYGFWNAVTGVPDTQLRILRVWLPLLSQHACTRGSAL